MAISKNVPISSQFKFKNKEIFDKAQKNNNSVDWYSRLQESKSALLATNKARSLSPDQLSLSEGAFDLMLSAKKELVKNTDSLFLTKHKSFKLSKEDEIKIGLEMIPMFQAKEEELTIKHKKLKSLKKEIASYMEQNNISKVKYT